MANISNFAGNLFRIVSPASDAPKHFINVIGLRSRNIRQNSSELQLGFRSMVTHSGGLTSPLILYCYTCDNDTTVAWLQPV